MNQMSQQQTMFPRIWTEIINNTLPINGVLKPDTSVVKRERAEWKQKIKKGGVGGVRGATSQAPLLKSVCNMKACREEEKGCGNRDVQNTINTEQQWWWSSSLMGYRRISPKGKIIRYMSDRQNNNKGCFGILSPPSPRLTENCSSKGSDTFTLREQIPFLFIQQPSLI